MKPNSGAQGQSPWAKPEFTESRMGPQGNSSVALKNNPAAEVPDRAATGVLSNKVADLTDVGRFPSTN
jgi:hypothetical protein